jgi:glycosyltransferase involved in cell wall biosynthesis
VINCQLLAQDSKDYWQPALLTRRKEQRCRPHKQTMNSRIGARGGAMGAQQPIFLSVSRKARTLWAGIRRRLQTANQSHRAPQVTIIIPLHGTEATVEKCVRSAMAQSFRAIEILCIDDASPDRSARIVQWLAREDGRIRLIRHGHNRGLGGARNSGILAARAPFVTGIDSDDFIAPEMIERLWQASEEGRVDVVACGFQRVHADGSPAAPSYQPPPGHYSNASQQLDIFEFLNPSFCNKIWRRSLFLDHNILFPEHTYFEDLAVTPKLLSKARDVRVIEGNYYKYFVRPGSITRSFSSRHILDHFRVFDILDQFLEHEGLKERYGEALRGRIHKSLAFHASEVLASSMTEHEKQQYLRHCLMLQRGYLQLQEQLRCTPPGALQALLLNQE